MSKYSALSNFRRRTFGILEVSEVFGSGIEDEWFTGHFTNYPEFRFELCLNHKAKTHTVPGTPMTYLCVTRRIPRQVKKKSQTTWALQTMIEIQLGTVAVVPNVEVFEVLIQPLIECLRDYRPDHVASMFFGNVRSSNGVPWM